MSPSSLPHVRLEPLLHHSPLPLEHLLHLLLLAVSALEHLLHQDRLAHLFCLDHGDFSRHA
jgi:hypothetical protein